MRALRVLLASALTFSAAAVVAAAPAPADPAPPYTAVTRTGDPMRSDGHPFAYADPEVVVPTHTTTSIELDVTRPAPAAALKIVITAPTGGVLAAGPTKYSTTATPTASAPGFEISEPPSTCWSEGGSLTIDEVTADPDPANSGNLLAFAAHYEYDCNGNADPVSGDLRYQSTVPYSAVVPSTPSWDFGTQAVKKDGWA